MDTLSRFHTCGLANAGAVGHTDMILFTSTNDPACIANMIFAIIALHMNLQDLPRRVKAVSSPKDRRSDEHLGQPAFNCFDE